MGGEGLGRSVDSETPNYWLGSAQDTRDTYDVVAVGDLIQDHVVPLADVPSEVRGDWERRGLVAGTRREHRRRGGA